MFWATIGGPFRTKYLKTQDSSCFYLSLFIIYYLYLLYIEQPNH